MYDEGRQKKLKELTRYRFEEHTIEEGELKARKLESNLRKAGHIEAADEARAKFKPRPKPPRVRASVRDVWRWFLAVSGCRKEGFNGLGGLDWGEAVTVLLTFGYATEEQLTPQAHDYMCVCMNELRTIEGERSAADKAAKDKERERKGHSRKPRRR